MPWRTLVSSTTNRATTASPRTALREDPSRKWVSTLMAHEFVHSWNGKYRRPAGLATGNYDKPMTGELLWVYEGLTEYLGDLLPVRSGILSADDYRENLAETVRADGAAHRTHVETVARHGRCRAVVVRSAGRVDELAAQRRLLPRGRAALAGCGHDDSLADGRQEVARRFLPRVLRRSERACRAEAVHVRRPRCRAQRRRAE